MSLEAPLWIDGTWIGASEASGGRGACINPANGETVGSFANGGRTEAEQAITAARRAFQSARWAETPRLREKVLLEFADRLATRAPEIEAVLTRANGKLLRESAVETQAAVSELRYYASLSRNLFGRMAEVDAGAYSLLAREPAGVAAIIVPWNAPLTLLIRSLAPALAAGCTTVVKAAHQTSLANALVINCLAEVAALPQGVVNVVYESASEASETLVRSPDVDVVSFTGSSATGKRIMAAAAGTLKRLSLELGGKAPSILFADCDQQRAVATITAAATVMAGQMCTAAARVIAHQSIAQALRAGFQQAFANLVVGPGDEAGSQMGPLIDRANRDRVLGLVDEAAGSGRMIVRGAAPGGRLANGAFVTPTLVEIDDLRSKFIQEELFAPFLVFETFTDEAEAIERANATRYGLAASVWTADLSRAHRVARALRSGTVWLNSYNRLFPEAETGGYRESGFGRMHGLEGLNDFLQTKHVYFETPA